jgi:hypothetical protein
MPSEVYALHAFSTLMARQFHCPPLSTDLPDLCQLSDKASPTILLLHVGQMRCISRFLKIKGRSMASNATWKCSFLPTSLCAGD